MAGSIDSLRRQELEKLARTHVCAECGGTLLTPWDAEVSAVVLRCSKDAGHEGLQRVPTKREQWLIGEPIPIHIANKLEKKYGGKPMDNRALTTTEQRLPMEAIQAIAMEAFKSAMFADLRGAPQAVIKILGGQELGLPPIYSLQKLYIIKGRLSVASEAMGVLIKRTRGEYDYRVKQLDDTTCIIEFTEKGQLAYTSTFTVADAKRADLVKPDSAWLKWPRAMLFARALSQGARIVCPHVIGGLPTYEELAEVPVGEYIEGEGATVPDEPESMPTGFVPGANGPVDIRTPAETASTPAETDDPKVCPIHQGPDGEAVFMTPTGTGKWSHPWGKIICTMDNPDTLKTRR